MLNISFYLSCVKYSKLLTSAVVVVVVARPSFILIQKLKYRDLYAKKRTITKPVLKIFCAK